MWVLCAETIFLRSGSEDPNWWVLIIHRLNQNSRKIFEKNSDFRKKNLRINEIAPFFFFFFFLNARKTRFSGFWGPKCGFKALLRKSNRFRIGIEIFWVLPIFVILWFSAKIKNLSEIVKNRQIPILTKNTVFRGFWVQNVILWPYFKNRSRFKMK